jgi:hypothetical protein
MDTGSSETRAAPPSFHPRPLCGFAPGTVLADRYRIVALVGRGGMGEVYRADDLKLGQSVALKFLPAELERDPAARDRLLAEVRNARTVSHPNVCRVYDIGEVERDPAGVAGGPGEGRVFITMEYIDGEDLASLLRRIGRLPAPKALDVARQLCAGLAAAHDKGVLHRDLKPANVMIDGRGQARITDFGLALEVGRDAAPADAAGTLAYMAPERFAGTPASVQSDLYGLGLILYETYTGHAPFKAATVGEWRDAHTSATPGTPSSHVSDIEPAVERAILRCLEKDPAKRPASAAQVAAALPGGDPLAAAIAAGETPSPELVAASGEEGTLPRAKEWLCFAACLVALAVMPFTLMPFNLSEYVSFELTPDALQARAREVLQDLGYRDAPVDSAWWLSTDADYLDRLGRMRRSEALADLRTARARPLVFSYRQAPARLVAAGRFGNVTRTDPPPQPGDLYVDLDLHGRLVTLRAVPPSYGDPQPAVPVDWTALFSAARFGNAEAFVQVGPRWWPESAPDVRDAREGLYAGQKVRVEAAWRAGRPVFFRLLPPWARPPQSPGAPSGRAASSWNALAVVLLLGFWVSLIVLTLLARRNLRLGRADRAAARRLAIGVTAVFLVARVCGAHSMLDAFSSRLDLLAMPLVTGLLAWLAYVGLEPPMRRTWPYLLISSTRLLDLRWRDPLVGRAVLAGVLVGLLGCLPATVAVHGLLGLPGGGPSVFVEGSLNDPRSFVGWFFFQIMSGLSLTLLLLAMLLVVRLIVRRTDVAWVAFAFLFIGLLYLNVQVVRPETTSRLILLAAAAFFGLLFTWVFWRHGALAFAVAGITVDLVDWAPWTADMSRWYAWRGWLVAAAVAGLAFWGFRNVLGKQSALPAGALDG